MRVVFLLLHIVIPVMTLRPHSLRLNVAVVQQQFYILHASPLRVHSRRRLRALTRAQPRRNEHALPAEHLYKFYHSGDMFGIHSYICCSGLLYSQSDMPLIFSDLA
jgi:hypothetical protein